jgi:hypothetical protein
VFAIKYIAACARFIWASSLFYSQIIPMDGMNA